LVGANALRSSRLATRFFLHDELPSIPFWHEPAIYQTEPAFSIRLEPGRYQISVARGMEYISVTKEFTLLS